jgi:hypothetical protein
MHHEHRSADAEFFQRLVDHPALDGRRGMLQMRAGAPAVAGTVDQDHPMIFGEPVAERLAHDLEIRARAMDHHDRRTGRIARPDIEDVQAGAGNLDHPALRGIGALQDEDTGPRDQRQDRQRRHDED